MQRYTAQGCAVLIDDRAAEVVARGGLQTDVEEIGLPLHRIQRKRIGHIAVSPRHQGDGAVAAIADLIMTSGIGTGAVPALQHLDQRLGNRQAALRIFHHAAHPVGQNIVERDDVGPAGHIIDIN